MATMLHSKSHRWCIAACLGAMVSAACSLVLDFAQCRDDTDCANAQGFELVCENSECVVPTDPSTVACSATLECIDRFDDRHVCGPAGQCASLTSVECPKIVLPEGSTAADVVLLGSITATSAPYDGIGVPLENAIQLAVQDFNAVATLAGGKKVGWVACDSTGKTSVAKKAAQHLQDLGVIGIVGPTFSDSVIGVAKDVTVPGGTFLITPTATAASITGLDDDGLVWRTISSDIHQGAALVDRISELTDPQPRKVVVFAKNDAYGNGLLEQITPLLAARLPEGGLIRLKYSDPGTFATNEALLNEYGMRIAIAYGNAPDTIVIIGTSEARELILFYMDVYFDADGIPANLPRFVVTHGGVPVLESVIGALGGSGDANPTVMRKLEGVSPIVQDEDNFTAFNVRYKIQFSNQEPITISSLSYDAAMVLMLAAAAVGSDTINGAAIAEAMPRLVDEGGTRISFGGATLDFISSAVEVLGDGGSVDLKGVSGELDFNLATGEVRTNLIGWDLVPRANNPAEPVLTPARIYALDDPPANGGTWTDL